MGVLDGKVVLVTGGAGGIGKECALLAAREGAKVVVNDLGGSVGGGDAGDAGPAEATAQEIRAAGGEAVSNSDSVASMDGVKRMIEQAKDTFGGLHAVVNPAGILRDKMFHKMDDADWDAVIEVHLRGAYNVTRASIELFRNQEEGSYVHFTSTSGLIGNIGQANYAAAKAGVAGMTRALARELGSRGITVNCVAPGFIATDMTAALGEEQHKALAAQIPLGRLGQPADIAAAVAYLASPEAGYVTGQELHVNGGMFMA